jgi:uncharacterized protein YbcV (DUF1398 family)
MTSSIALGAALDHGARIRPPVGGFPYLAETLRRAGVSHCRTTVASNASTYLLGADAVVVQHDPIVAGMAEVAPFDEHAIATALRADQAGETTFSEFLRAAHRAGVVWFEVDLEARTVTYHGAFGDRYVEAYELVEV